MEIVESGNRRIARNTVILYFRMLITMLVGFWAARITLNALGVEDYGVNSAVGGMVAMFSLLTGSLAAASSRYMTFGLGKGNISYLKRVFSMTMNIHTLMAVVVVLLMETVGVWFLNTQMEFPDGRLEAANWVMQCSVLNFVIGLVSVPYNSAIIAHEKMSVFAYMTIFDVVTRLLIVLSLWLYDGDRLILYAVLFMVQGLIRQFVYWIYCKRNFEECTYHRIWDKRLARDLFGFAGWNFFGAGSALLMTQGVNVLINIFFGVVANAARGVAVQVEGVVMQFVNNFTTAINPQITKSYAAGNFDRMFTLVFKGARFSFYLMLMIAVPLMVEADYVLKLWLGLVPDKAALFLRYTLAISLISVLSRTMITMMLATGNIKKYQIIVGGTGMLVLPLAYLFYKFGFPVETAYVIHFLVFCVQLVQRMFFLKEMVGMKIPKFVRGVLCRTLPIAAVSFAVPVMFVMFVPEASFLRLVLTVLISEAVMLPLIYFFGMEVSERQLIKDKVNTVVHKIFRSN